MHDVQAPVQDVLFHLEFGDAISQQSADAIGPFEHRYPMACLIQLCGCSQSRRTGTDDSDGFSSACQWPPRSNQAFLEGAVDDGDFDVLDRDWIDRKSTRMNSSHLGISYAVFC